MSKLEWWREHSDWSPWTRLRFLYNGFRVALPIERSIRGAWSVAHIAGWISTRRITSRDIQRGQEIARKHGWGR